MRGDHACRAYRALLLLHPRRFRRDFGDAMVQLHRDRRRDGTSWFRDVADLLRSVPVQHKEALRTMTTSGKLVTAAITTGVCVATFAVIGGGYAALTLTLLLAWIVAALLRERSGQPAGTTSWKTTGWKLAALGAGTFAVAFVFFGGPWPDSWREAVPGDVAWGVGFLAFVGSIVLVTVGLLTVVAGHVAGRRLSR